jgi:hypothetical protein
MIDHTGFAVSDLIKSKAFYAAALRPLRIELIMEVTAEQTGRKNPTPSKPSTTPPTRVSQMTSCISHARIATRSVRCWRSPCLRHSPQR